MPVTLPQTLFLWGLTIALPIFLPFAIIATGYYMANKPL